MVPDDALAAALEEIRGNHAEAEASRGLPDLMDRAYAFYSSVMDVPRLLAAVGAALSLADTAKPGLTAACTCYDCERWGDGETPGYEDYEPHPGRVLAWTLDPAELREAITRALAGEEAGDVRS